MLKINILNKICLVLIFTMTSYGCSDTSPDAMMNNYLYRLANALDVEQTTALTIPLRPLFPPTRERLIPIPELREGLLNVLKLNECQLISLIAERNSSLGKVYRPSLKMRYELQFLQQLNDCVARLNNTPQVDPELLTLTAELQAFKQAHIISEVWNGIYTSESIELNFSRKYQPLPITDTGSSPASISALKALHNLTEQDLTNPKLSDAQLQEVEAAFKVLFANTSGIQALSSIELLTATLNQATTLINQRLSGRPLCFNESPNNQARILRNVFYKYYIAEIQRYMAQSHRTADQWLTLNQEIYERLLELKTPIQISVRNYFHKVIDQSATDSIWMNYIIARDKHTEGWQNLLKQCGMMPTKRH